MKFNLTAPCKDCPFRTDIPSQEGWLGYERAEGIAEALWLRTVMQNPLSEDEDSYTASLRERVFTSLLSSHIKVT